MDLILPDVNVLVYAYRQSAPEHERYVHWLEGVRHDSELGLTDTVLLGVVRVATDARIFPNAAPTTHALEFVDTLRGSPRARQIGPTAATWGHLARFAAMDRGVRGKLIPDAWLAALAISHGARLATADRGFARYDGLDWFDPVRD